MSEQKEKVEINLIPVMATLEALAEDVRRLSELGVSVTHHALRIPKDYPVDFLKASEAAVNWINQNGHPNINATSVARGYELLKTGEVSVFYLGD